MKEFQILQREKSFIYSEIEANYEYDLLRLRISFPDFILWVIEWNKQRIVFIDPKWLRNIDDGFNNRKLRLYGIYLKTTCY